eukprot:EG_transcript_3779
MSPTALPQLPTVADCGRSLIAAAAAGDGALLKALLAQGVAVDSRNADGFTALQMAAYYGHLAATRVLVEAKADVNEHWFIQCSTEEVHRHGLDHPEVGLSPLAMAAASGHVPVVEYLLHSGADVHVSARGTLAPVMIAASLGHVAVLQSLIKAKAALEEALADGATALVIAATAGNLKVVRLLHAAGAALDPPCTPSVMHRAAVAGAHALVGYLLEHGAQYSALDPAGFSCLGAAAQHGHVRVVQQFLTFGLHPDAVRSQGETTALHCAAYARHLGVVKLLVAHQASLERQDASGTTPLQAAVQGGDAAVVRFLLHACLGPELGPGGSGGESGVLRRCMRAQARFPGTVHQHYETTLLHIACHHGHAHLVPCILNLGVEIDAVDTFGRSALRVACEDGHVAVVRQLLQCRANPDLGDRFGTTPLMAACHYGHEATAHAMLAARCDVGLWDLQGLTALHRAAWNGHLGIVASLIKDVTDPATLLTGVLRPDHKRRLNAPPPVALAARDGHCAVLMHLLAKMAALGYYMGPVLQRCLAEARRSGRAAVAEMIADCFGWSPLHYHCRLGDTAAATQLLHRGADPLKKARNGTTPLDLATQHGLGHVKHLLQGALCWNSASHHLFPPAVRRAIRFLLLLHERQGGLLPYDLWPLVFSFLPRTLQWAAHPAPLSPTAPPSKRRPLAYVSARRGKVARRLGPTPGPPGTP